MSIIRLGILLVIIFILLVVIVGLIKKFKRLEKVKQKKIIQRIVTTIVLLLFINAISYMPKKITNIDYEEVALIKIQNGNTGELLEIVDKDDIKHIIENLNSVTFKKDKFIAFNIGYSYKTDIYNDKNNFLKGLIINSDSVISYNGYSYNAKENLIDYDYISNLYKNKFN